MKHLLVVLICITTLGKVSYGQISDKEIVFESEDYDFGTVNFGKQKINATFIFTNNSSIDFKIREVKASCGCTVPSWPENPIKPGQKGVITATFDPSNLAGEVDKSIEIFANYSGMMSKIIRIKGIIKEPVSQDMSKIYPGQFGYIRQSKNTIALGDILTSKTYSKTVIFMNDYNLPLSFTGVLRKPDYVTYELSKTVIPPGDTASVKIIVHGDLVNNYGLINDDIVFKTTDKSYALKAVKLAFFMREDFSVLSKKERKNAPSLMVSKTEFDFGEMKEGAVSTQEFTMKNSGKTPLKIYRVITHCGCTTIDLEETEIAPGESKTVKIKFDSIFVSGQAQKEVTLYTNDPENHEVVLYVTATVKEY